MISSMTRRALAPVLAGALVVGVTACSSDDDTASTDDSTDVSSPAEAGGVTVVEAGVDATTADALTEAASTAFAETSAPGAVMAIRTADGDWVATAGYQDGNETVPMAADINQRIGSVTKTFTVTALLQLAEAGELSLDDPIEQYVPGMPNGDATLGDLAAMRSGIPSYTFDEGFQEILFSDPNRVWEPQQLVDLVKGDGAHVRARHHGLLLEHQPRAARHDHRAGRRRTHPGRDAGADPRALGPRRHLHANRRRLSRSAPAGLHDAGRRRRRARRRHRLEPVVGVDRRGDDLRPRRHAGVGRGARHGRGHPLAGDAGRAPRLVRLRHPPLHGSGLRGTADRRPVPTAWGWVSPSTGTATRESCLGSTPTCSTTSQKASRW